jgi:HEAT repeat protein
MMEPPPGTKYPDVDDWHARAQLEANDVGNDDADLVAALTSPNEQLRPLAAQALGKAGGAEAVAALLDAARSPDDHLAVAAAAALARLGDPRGIGLLQQLLGRSVSTTVVPLLAAGALARVDVPDGYPAVRAGLDAANFLVRIAAAKQLYYFVPLHDQQCPDGSRVDAFAGYRQALRDPNDDVRWAALYQLQSVTHLIARELLEEFIASGPADWLATEARRMLTERKDRQK